MMTMVATSVCQMDVALRASVMLGTFIEVSHLILPLEQCLAQGRRHLMNGNRIIKLSYLKHPH